MCSNFLYFIQCMNNAEDFCPYLNPRPTLWRL